MLPRGAGGHRVLITSRDTLAALPDARLLDLHVLDPDAAEQLLVVELTQRRPGDVRVAADPAAATRLVNLCGGLLCGQACGRSAEPTCSPTTDRHRRGRATVADAAHP